MSNTRDFIKNIVMGGNGDDSRTAQLAEALPRFTGGPARLVNWLSTAALVVPADFNGERTEIFMEKIWDALDYATTFLDVGELNALEKLAPTKPNAYVALGLYLYLADACSRLNPDTTFLTAMRQARASLTVDDEVDRAKLLMRVELALENAGLGDEQRAVLSEWAAAGTYTIAGVKHCNNGWNLYGAYAQLASDISHRQDLLGMNLLISFALGNKKEIEGYNPDSEAYAYIEKLQADPDKVTDLIRTGALLREHRMRREAYRVFTEDKGLAIATDNAMYERARMPKVAEAMFAYYPDDMLRLLNSERYHIVYSEDKDISQALPEGQLPGLTREGTKRTQESKGGRLDRYRTLFVSHGMEIAPSTQVRVFNDDDEKYKNLAQTTLHELFHVAYSLALKSGKQGDLISRLDGLTEALSNAVRANSNDPALAQNLVTVQVNVDPVRHVLDHRSPVLYDSYHKTIPDTSREEVMCNLYGLRFTEPEKLNGLPLDVQRAVTALSAELDKVVKVALDISREKNPAKSARTPG